VFKRKPDASLTGQKHIRHNIAAKFIPYVRDPPVSKEFSAGVTLSRNTFTWLHFFPQIDGLEQEEEEEESGILFQQSGAPSHCSYETQNALNVRFCNWWIGIGRPTPWPP
jgi:hypothetical protein